MRSCVQSGRRALLSLTRIVLWVFVNITVLLSAWVLLGWSVGGWSPVVITSGSMEPTVGTGDVLLVDTEPGPAIAQRTIIVFDRDGETIAHRVFAVEGERLITKGDANASPDTRAVTADEVRGSGRLVVPMIGLPVVWWQQGAWVPLAAWLILMGAAAVRLAFAADRVLVRRRRTVGSRANASASESAAASRHPVGRIGIQRVRALVAVLIVAQFALDRDRFEVVNGPIGSLALVVASALALLATNVLASWADGDLRRSRAGALVELAVDTALVVVLATATGSSGFGWVLFSLPIIEAAVRFRLVGALVHWMLLTIVTLAAKVWAGAGGPSTLVIDDLETVLDQLSVLLLVVIPAAYLAEQLLGEVTTWQQATGQAVDRSHLLVRVADIGRDIVRLDGGHIDAILAGTRSLGFARTDIVVQEGDGGWRVIAGDDLPAAGGPGSCVTSADLAHGAAYIDDTDPDVAEVRALRDAGLAAVLSQVVSSQAIGEHDRRPIVLRAGLPAGDSLSSELVEAFTLLAGQATVALRNEQLVAEITTIHDELEHRALHDALTGLPNRAQLLQALTGGGSASVAPVLFFLDLNGFKPVNDRLGHDAGDAILQMVAERLRHAAPAGALVARLGGDEFTVLVTSGITPVDAQRVAATIAAAIRQPYDIGRHTVHISTSVGIALGGADIGEGELIRRADVAMYAAKRAAPAGERIEIYRSDFDADASRRATLLADLPGAITSGTITLAYQPIFDVASVDRIVGAEALVRWRHPVLGDVAPGELIEIAHAADLQDVLNRHIAHLACHEAARWRAVNPARRCFVNVNASPDELGSPALIDNITSALASAALPADWLFVEISERLVSPATDAVLANVARLRDLGVGLFLDDFGQGNTSLSYLHELPLAGIKLDRRLVVNALRSDTDRVVLRSIVGLSAQLGHLVIAEGIESVEHLAAVVAAGCTMAQGYHLGRPDHGDAIVERVRHDLDAARHDVRPALHLDVIVDAQLHGGRVAVASRPSARPTAGSWGAPAAEPATRPIAAPSLLSPNATTSRGAG